MIRNTAPMRAIMDKELVNKKYLLVTCTKEEAIANNESMYLSDTPCKKDPEHLVRYVSDNRCVTCTYRRSTVYRVRKAIGTPNEFARKNDKKLEELTLARELKEVWE